MLTTKKTKEPLLFVKTKLQTIETSDYSETLIQLKEESQLKTKVKQIPKKNTTKRRGSR